MTLRTEYKVKDLETGATYTMRAYSPLALVQELLGDESGNGFAISNPANGGEWELRQGKLICLFDPSVPDYPSTCCPPIAAASPEPEKGVS